PLSAQRNEPPEPEATSPAVLDHEEGLRLAAGKADLARDMLQMLLREHPETARSIASARQQGDQAALRLIIHKQHDAPRHCGVPQRRASCQEAEARLKQGEDSAAAVEAVLVAISRLRDTAEASVS